MKQQLTHQLSLWLYKQADRLEHQIVRQLASVSVPFLRISMGVIYIWFGVLKFFPGLSPAQDLALDTIDVLTFGLMPSAWSLALLALLECAIGIGFLTGRYIRATLLLLAFQMAGALSPLVLFPNEVFTTSFITPTLEGQYIIKNLVLIGAGLVIGATVRGGRIVVDSRQPYNNFPAPERLTAQRSG